MSVPRITRATVVVLALAVAGVPVARRLCGLTCEAAPAEAAVRPHHPHCPAHPPPSERTTPESRPNPCGHGHGGDGALLTASASSAKSGARTSETPAPAALLASHPSLLAPCGWPAGFDRRLATPPPAAHHRILRL